MTYTDQVDKRVLVAENFISMGPSSAFCCNEYAYLFEKCHKDEVSKYNPGPAQTSAFTHENGKKIA